MTDAEKDLRRLAQESLSDAKVWSGRALTEFQSEATPTAVLALLDRIEALEKQAADAERKGAGEMRKAAADWLRACSARATFTLHTPDGRPLNAEERRMHGEVETGLKSALGTLADDIANRPLPGDAP